MKDIPDVVALWGRQDMAWHCTAWCCLVRGVSLPHFLCTVKVTQRDGVRELGKPSSAFIFLQRDKQSLQLSFKKDHSQPSRSSHAESSCIGCSLPSSTSLIRFKPNVNVFNPFICKSMYTVLQFSESKRQIKEVYKTCERGSLGTLVEWWVLLAKVWALGSMHRLGSPWRVPHLSLFH